MSIQHQTWLLNRGEREYFMTENTQSHNKSIGKWISVIYRKFQIDINKTLKPYSLNSSQYIFLVQLYQADRVSQDYLAKKLHIDKSAVARAIQQLENNGYVTRTVNSEDRRSNIVSLTNKAVLIKEELKAILSGWNAKLTGSLSDKEYDLVYSLLEQMAADILRDEE